MYISNILSQSLYTINFLNLFQSMYCHVSNYDLSNYFWIIPYLLTEPRCSLWVLFQSISRIMETNTSSGFNISLTDATTTDDVSLKYLHAIIMAAISMIFIEASVHIYKKNRNDLEPIYILELNTLVRECFI